MTKNEIVARFYGYEFINDAPDFYPDGYYMLRNDEGRLTLPLDKDDFNFSTSYDWLMLVWVKFRDLKPEGMPFNLVHPCYCRNIANAITNKSITETFDELVKAIEWYNSLKK